MSLTAVPNTPAAENDELEMLRINIQHWRKEESLREEEPKRRNT